jgi:hypothetical protein
VFVTVYQVKYVVTAGQVIHVGQGDNRASVTKMTANQFTILHISFTTLRSLLCSLCQVSSHVLSYTYTDS